MSEERLKKIKAWKSYQNPLNKVFNGEDKVACLVANDDHLHAGSKLINDKARIRTLTPIEYERLQTVPDNYTSIVSDAKRYRMLGNGWTVDVITHIFKNIKR